MKTLAILLAIAAAGFAGQQYQAQQDKPELAKLRTDLKNWQDYSFSESTQDGKNVASMIREGNELDAAERKIAQLQTALQAAQATVPCTVRYDVHNDVYYCQALQLRQQ